MVIAHVRGIRRVAHVDLDALRANLADAAGGTLDARADAYGHGLAVVAGVAAEAGLDTLLVSDDRDAAVCRAAGLGVQVGRPEHAPDSSRRIVSAAAYGLDPAHPSRPVMRVVAEVIALKRVGAGAGVSYGYTYRTTTSTTLALVGLGYADGIPRLASNRGEVLLGHERRPLVGRIAMDQFVVDAGDGPAASVAVGDEVVVFGDAAAGEPSAVEWATATERSPLELTAGLGRRIVRTSGGRS